MNYYIAINLYRSSTSDGFANTYAIRQCKNRAEQHKLLTVGLPVNDIWHHDGSQSYSNFGIRPITQAERREVLKADYTEFVNEFVDLTD